MAQDKPQNPYLNEPNGYVWQDCEAALDAYYLTKIDALNDIVENRLSVIQDLAAEVERLKEEFQKHHNLYDELGARQDLVDKVRAESQAEIAHANQTIMMLKLELEQAESKAQENEEIARKIGFDIATETERKLAKKQVEEIIREIERGFFAEPQYVAQSGLEPVLGCIEAIDWQALKQRNGVTP